MGYFDEETFSFLRELKRNNDRAWFNANKKRYEESVKEPFLRFIEDVGPELRKVSRNLVADPRPVGGSLFRIYRDVRFSKDKSPYKTHVGAHFPLGKGMAAPGYYLISSRGSASSPAGCGCPSRRPSRASENGSPIAPPTGGRRAVTSTETRPRSSVHLAGSMRTTRWWRT